MKPDTAYELNEHGAPNKDFFNIRQRIKKTYLEKYLPQFINHLKASISDFDNIPIGESLYRYYNDVPNGEFCKVCGKLAKFISFSKGYAKYCSKSCAFCKDSELYKLRKETTEKNYIKYGSKEIYYKELAKKSKQTSMDKYGSMEELYKSRYEKMKQTCLEKYGVENPSKMDGNYEKVQQTCLERYGDPNFRNIEKGKNTINNKYGSIEKLNQIRHEKMKQTCLEKYGVEWASQTEEFREKVKQTCLERYGVETTFKAKECIEKGKQTLLNRYGVDNIAKSNFLFEKYKKRMLHNNDDLLDIEYAYTDKPTMYICKCSNDSCNMCEEKQFKIPAKLYNTRRNQYVDMCTIRNPIGEDRNKNTSIELFVRDILDEHDIEYICNDKTILNGKELDIYIPSKNIAIECNGDFFHAINGRKKDMKKLFHYEKYINCANKGICLISVWDSERINNPELLTERILTALSIGDKPILENDIVVNNDWGFDNILHDMGYKQIDIYEPEEQKFGKFIIYDSGTSRWVKVF